MSRSSQMSKILSSHLAPLITLGIRNLGAAICHEISTTSTTYSNNIGHMSERKRSITTVCEGDSNGGATEEDEEDGYRRAREYIRMHATKSSSSSSGSENVSSSANQAQQENYNEKQSVIHVDFHKVKEPPPPSSEQWWYPDPFTGQYVPRNNYGEISRSVLLQEEEKDILRKQVLDVEKALKKPPAPSPVLTRLSGVPSKGEKGGWWTSMEELPDLDHCSMRC